MIPINQRKKFIPLPKPKQVVTKSRAVGISNNAPEPTNVLAKHHLRKRELALIHGIPEKDIFVDPGNGVELYRTVSGGWVTNPIYRGVE